MSASEIMTIIIAFHMSYHRDFKNFYIGIVQCYHHNDFPNLLSYTRFLEVMPSGIKVCHNLSIPRHKVFALILQSEEKVQWDGSMDLNDTLLLIT